MFNLKTSSKRQWKWYGWSSWFFVVVLHTNYGCFK